MEFSRSLMYGDIAEQNSLPPKSNNSLIEINGIFRNKHDVFTLDETVLSRHMMLVGGTGCGKTELTYHFVNQLKNAMTPDDVMIIFDTKGDYHKEFYNSERDKIIGNSTQYKSVSEKWNIFREILADGWESSTVSQNTQEICKSLFAERTEGNNSNPFFPNAARDLLGAILISYIRAGLYDHKKGGTFVQDAFNNEELKNLLDSSDSEYIINCIKPHSDLKSVASYIKGGGGQSQGVLSEMFSVTRDIFTGVFADKGLFSIREFVRKKGARTLFIEYDLAIGSVLGPMYTLLFDLALREALGRTKSNGNVYFIIDELKLLPHLQHLDDGINFGRSLGVKIIVGLQNIKQLEASYDVANARNIIYGFSSIFAFRSNDPETRKYASELFGKNKSLELFNMNSPDLI
jgi:type IV secretory pathway TraG/TraD family ATPase VirD4